MEVLMESMELMIRVLKGAAEKDRGFLADIGIDVDDYKFADLKQLLPAPPLVEKERNRKCKAAIREEVALIIQKVLNSKTLSAEIPASDMSIELISALQYIGLEVARDSTFIRVSLP